MKISYIVILSFIFLVIVSGCNKNDVTNEPISITINLEDAELINIDPSQVTQLETSDSSLIYDIGAMAVYDEELVVQSRSLMKVFDRKTGKFLRDISKKGEGPGEYLSLTQFWNEGDTLCIVDFTAGLLRKYLKNGDPLEDMVDLKSISGPDLYQPQYFVDLPDKNGYCVINSYRGGLDYNPQFAFLTKDFKFNGIVPERILMDGANTPDRMYTDFNKNRILAWEQLRDTLFQINSNGVVPLYVFDFGDNSFPKEFQEKPELWERIQKFMEEREGIPYASFIKYYQSHWPYLFFSFITSNNEVYLGIYNEEADIIRTVRLIDPADNYRQSLFFKIIDDGVLVSLSSKNQVESNPSLYFLTFDELLN